MKRTIAACCVAFFVAGCGDDGNVHLILDVQDVNVSTPEDTPLTVQLPVTSNRQLNVTVTTPPSHGKLVNVESTYYQYTPDANYNGSDSLTLTFDNGQETKTGTAHITVTPVDDAPVAGPDSIAAGFATSVTIQASTLLQNDTDIDNTDLSITGVAAGAHGTVAMNGTSIVFTPEAGFSGAATFTYTLSDGSVSAQGNVAVAVGPNAAPVAGPDTGNATEDTLFTVTNTTLLANDTDADHQTLAIVDAGGATHGTVTRNAANVTFMPDPNYNGPASFTYTITDGAAQSTATVTLAVAAVNDPPQAADDANVAGLTTAEDTALSIPKAVLLANDTDVDGDALRITAVSNATHGTVSLPASAVGDTVLFTPAANYNGTAGFDYTITDGTATATAHVTLTITAVNDAPVAVDDARTIPEDTDLLASTGSLTSNDTDAEGDSLFLTAVANAQHGTVTLLSGNIVFHPDANYNGPASFDYTVTDGNASDTGTVNITVTPVDDAPDAINDTVATDEDVPLPISVLANDLDVDGPALTVSATTNPSHGTVTLAGGVITYRPAANYNGPDSFTYTASDGTLSDTATVSITVRPVDDAPIAVADSVTTPEDTQVLIDVLANDSDVEGPVTLTGVTAQPTHGVATVVNGKVNYAPAKDYFGSDAFTYTITDGTGNSTVGMVTIRVTPVDDAPVAADDGYTVTNTITVPASQGVLINDTDIDSINLKAVLDSPPQVGTVTLNPDGSFTYTLFQQDDPCDFSDEFTYHVNDGTLDSNIVTVHLTLNHRPVGEDDFFETSTGFAVAGNVLDNNGDGFDYDLDNDPISVVLVSPPQFGVQFQLNADGSFSYTPDPTINTFVTDTFTYKVSDGRSQSDETIVYIDVYGGNGSGGGSSFTTGPAATSSAIDAFRKPQYRSGESPGVIDLISCCQFFPPPTANQAFGGPACDDFLPLGNAAPHSTLAQ